MCNPIQNPRLAHFDLYDTCKMSVHKVYMDYLYGVTMNSFILYPSLYKGWFVLNPIQSFSNVV